MTFNMPQFKALLLACIAAWCLISSAMAQINFSSRPCSSRQGKIVGGEEVDKNEMPFIVSLTRRGGHFCGASIIHERWLLTAGHCICNGLNKFLKADQIQGVVGLHSIKEFLNNVQTSDKNHVPLKVNFKAIVPHPNYQCTKVQNDIALIEVLQPIVFSSYIQPTCLAFEGGISIVDHDIATVSGWGWTQENQEIGERADILRKADVQIWNNKKCETSYRDNGKSNNLISDTQMCAGLKNGGIDSCWGLHALIVGVDCLKELFDLSIDFQQADSGGPLVSRDNVLIGVVSTGIGCARPGLPGIYTRVSKYIQWIESVIKAT